MSKLVSQYNALKQKDKNKIYLFRSGIFYVALDKDAEFLSNAIGFKLTPLNETTQKCGFPVSRIDYYKKIFDIGNINYELVNDNVLQMNVESIKHNERLISLMNKLASIDFDEITYKQAYQILEDTSKKIKQITL